MRASAGAVPCALDQRSRKVRALAATGALGLFLIGTPLLVALAVARAVSSRAITREGADLGRADVVALVVALTAICMWLPGAVAALAELRRRDRPPRPSTFVPSSIRRIVAALIEASLLGAGTLRGWTSTRVDGSLADLEVPGPRTMGVVDVPDDAENPAGAAVTGADRAEPVRASPATLGRLTPPSPLGPIETTDYVVQRGDTWWGLAERFLGDGRRFAELKELNLGLGQPDGAVVQRDTVLRAGWTIEVPANGAPR